MIVPKFLSSDHFFNFLFNGIMITNIVLWAFKRSVLTGERQWYTRQIFLRSIGSPKWDMFSKIG